MRYDRDVEFRPVLIHSLSKIKVKMLASGNFHTLAMSDDGKGVYAWGMTDNGRLGLDDGVVIQRDEWDDEA